MSRFRFVRFWRQVHLVDRCLVIMLLILLIQSTAGLFWTGIAETIIMPVDVVVRTTSSAIFGYLLGGNFGKQNTLPGQAQSDGTAHILENSPTEETLSPNPQARIGFTVEGEPQSTELTAEPAKIRRTEDPDTNRVQVLVAASIGIFCLGVLLTLRNLTALGFIGSLSDSATATVTQFRDYVSGCVGFLIGSPMGSSKSNS